MPRLFLAALALSILSLPLVLVQKVAVGGATFSVSYLFIAGLFGWAVLAGLVRLRPELNAPFSPAALLPWVYLGSAVLGAAIHGPDPAFVMSAGLWVGAILVGALLDAALCARMLRLLSLIGQFAALLGIVLYVFNIPLLDLDALASDMYFVNEWGHYRASSIFLNPNSFAYFLLLVFCAYLFGGERHGWRQRLLVGACGVAFFLSGSRSGFLALIFLLALAAGRALPARPRFMLFSAGKLGLLAGLVVLLALSEYFSALDVRYEKWAFSLEIFFKSPEFWLLGIPPSVPIAQLGLSFSDNMFLMILFRLGIPGFLVFLAYYLWIVWTSLQRIVWGSDQQRVFAAFLLVSTVLMFYSNLLYFYPLVLIHGIAVAQVCRRPHAPGANATIAKASQ